MKNIKRAKLVESSFLFLVAVCLMLFSPLVGKAQNNSRVECKWDWRWVWEREPQSRYNAVTGSYETEYVMRHVYRHRYDCDLVPAAPNSAIPRIRKSSYPNTFRNSDGTLRPAKGYQWINSEDPSDFRVRLMPGLLKSGDGFRPDKGYRWVNPKDSNDLRVEPIP